jgi:hypothetical protein
MPLTKKLQSDNQNQRRGERDDTETNYKKAKGKRGNDRKKNSPS